MDSEHRQEPVVSKDQVRGCRLAVIWLRDLNKLLMTCAEEEWSDSCGVTIHTLEKKWGKQGGLVGLLKLVVVLL